jgi:hypothetical protein
VVALGTITAVALAACADGRDESAGLDAQAPEVTETASDEVLTGADGDTDAPAATVPPDQQGGSALGGTDVAGADLTTVGRDIAIELHVTMTSNDLRGTVQGIMRSAATHGGAVFASDIDYGADVAGDDNDEATPTGRATLTVKVPPAELGAMLSGLDQLGTVLSTNQQAHDVTDQLVDLAVRIRNAEQSVDRVREFLEATTDLRQMVDLEAELTRRQTDLERLLATQASVAERVALSTLTIDVHPASAAPDSIDDVDDNDDGIGDAFRSGWNAFLGVLFAVGFVLAILAPFLVLAAIVLAIAWIVARPRWHRPAHVKAPELSDDEDLARANHPG